MPLYRDMDQAALDAAYDNAAAVGKDKRTSYVEGWAARSRALLGANPQALLDLAYGATPRERLDFIACGRADAPTLAYFHGGYWQSNDKETYAFIAEGLLPAGFNFALIEYTLAPAARMDRIVAEARAAVAWLLSNLGELGGDPARLYLAGHSAGGHLVAMAMDEKRLAGGLAISGLYDLEPIRLNYLNDKLALDRAEAARNSPLLHLPERAARLLVAVGTQELPELVRQSRIYFRAWTQKGLVGEYLPQAGRDHFSVLEELARPDGKLLAALLALDAKRR